MRRRPLALLIVTAGGLAIAPAAASAQTAAPSLHIVTERVGGERATILQGTRFRVRVIVKPYVVGQQVTVTMHRRGRTIRTKTLTARKGATAGQVLTGYAPRTSGQIEVRAVSGPVAAQAARIDVLPRRATPGSRGRAVRALQDRLKKFGYVVGEHGVYDDRTARAVLAFRKVVGLSRTAVADETFFRALAAGKGAFGVRFRRHGRHVEADISRQVIALIGAGGKVERIYPTSTGAPGTPTILGTFRVYLKDPGTNAKGMVASSYFIRGYAIHGYHSVPVYNASHGCLRVPIPDAYSIYAWVKMGTIVDTYL
jgi:peptidoglycan hydrolase-like protein with peptidoglycan-binding domain